MKKKKKKKRVVVGVMQPRRQNNLESQILQTESIGRPAIPRIASHHGFMEPRLIDRRGARFSTTILCDIVPRIIKHSI
jgi:hypothetical protein